jgi:hypothetical protein
MGRRGKKPPKKPEWKSQQLKTQLRRAERLARIARAVNIACVIAGVAALYILNRSGNGKSSHVSETVYAVGFVPLTLFVFWAVQPFWKAHEEYQDKSHPEFRRIYLKSLKRYVLADSLLIAWTTSCLLDAFGLNRQIAAFFLNAGRQALGHALSWLINGVLSSLVGNIAYAFLKRYIWDPDSD